MTVRMVKSSQFGKIAEQAGRNKQGGRKDFFKFIKQAGWKSVSRVAKNLKNLSEHALLLGTSE